MKVLELKGYKSLRALNAFSAMILGVKMLPAYMNESYEDFLARVQSMSPRDQESIIRAAAQFVKLEREEIEALVCFCTDKNGVPYSAENINNLGPAEFVECIVSVCLKVAEIKIDFLTESEKKN